MDSNLGEKVLKDEKEVFSDKLSNHKHYYKNFVWCEQYENPFHNNYLGTEYTDDNRKIGAYHIWKYNINIIL